MLEESTYLLSQTLGTPCLLDYLNNQLFESCLFEVYTYVIPILTHMQGFELCTPSWDSCFASAIQPSRI